MVKNVGQSVAEQGGGQLLIQSHNIYFSLPWCEILSFPPVHECRKPIV